MTHKPSNDNDNASNPSATISDLVNLDPIGMRLLQTPGASSSYLSIARSPSLRIASPTPASKKLLILDLNGTLLLRPKPRMVKSRPILPRPYMPSFRKFLFHEDVIGWLDVMVWSSAQPHSVDQMVDKCFGETRSQMKAVWARDTLGLGKVNYCACCGHSELNS